MEDKIIKVVNWWKNKGGTVRLVFGPDYSTCCDDDEITADLTTRTSYNSLIDSYGYDVNIGDCVATALLNKLSVYFEDKDEDPDDLYDQIEDEKRKIKESDHKIKVMEAKMSAIQAKSNLTLDDI